MLTGGKAEAAAAKEEEETRWLVLLTCGRGRHQFIVQVNVVIRAPAAAAGATRRWRVTTRKPRGVRVETGKRKRERDTRRGS